jgi:DNA polymerase III epsilon subunit-like protein
MILLKNLLIEAKIYGWTIDEMLEHLKMFEGKTLVFFDTEASGLEPNSMYEQVTQIAAMAVDGTAWKPLGEFNEKIALTAGTQRLLTDPRSPEGRAYMKDYLRWLRKYKKPYLHPRDALKTTHYYDGQPMETRRDEKTVLIAFEEFLKKWPNVVIIAHNAKFDMKMMGARRRLNDLPPLPKYKVFDTVKLVRHIFIPLLVSLEKQPWAAEMLTKMRAKTKYVSYGADLGKLADALQIETNWHDALEDVKALIQMFSAVIKLMEKNRDTNIRGFQGTQGRRFRHFKG